MAHNSLPEVSALASMLVRFNLYSKMPSLLNFFFVTANSIVLYKRQINVTEQILSEFSVMRSQL